MSVLRVGIEGKGVGKAVKYSEKDERGFTDIIVGDKSFKMYRVNHSVDIICFETGLSDECYDELDAFKEALAARLPDVELHFEWHSTMSSTDGSYFFGFMDEEYIEWNDYICHAYCEEQLIGKGIGKIPEYGGKDRWDCTHIFVNDVEFALFDFRIREDSISYSLTWDGPKNKGNLIEELLKASPETTIESHSVDFLSGEDGATNYWMENGEIKKEFVDSSF